MCVGVGGKSIGPSQAWFASQPGSSCMWTWKRWPIFPEHQLSHLLSNDTANDNSWNQEGPDAC